MGNALSWPKRQTHVRLQLDKDNSAAFKLFADDPFRGEAEAVSIETQRPLEVVYTDSDYSNPRLHGDSSEAQLVFILHAKDARTIYR